MTTPSRKRTWPLALLAAGLSAAIFAADLKLPLGIAGGVPYVAVVLMGWWFPRRIHIFVLAAICSVLTAAGYVYSPEGAPSWIVLVNRSLALFAIGVTAALLFTARKATASFRESEESYRAIVETQTELIRRCSPDGIRTFVNEAFCHFYGHGRDELIGTASGSFFLREEFDFPEWGERLKKMSPENPSIEAEVRVLSAGDKVSWLQWIDTGTFDENGALTGVQGVGRDITKRKEAEFALQESEERFRSVINNSPTFITLKDTDGRFKLVNQEHTDLFGFEQKAIQGKLISEVLHKKVADDSTSQDRKVIETKAVVVEERHILTKRGTFDFLVTKFPVLDKSGAVREIGTIGIDITDRKRAEEKLRENELRLTAIADNLPGGLYRRVLHPDGSISYPYLSEEFCRLLGIDQEEAMADSRCLREKIHPDDEKKTIEAMKESAKNLGPYDCEQRLAGEDGEFLWVRSIAQPHREKNGDVVWDGMIVDITEQKRAQAELEEAKQTADDANQAKSDFLAAMSHELRTPLNGILGFAQLLETDTENPLASRQKDSVRQILDGGEHLLVLVEDVLDLAKIEAGDFPMDVKPQDPKAVITGCAALAGTLCEQKGLTFYDRTAGWTMPKVSIDSTRLQQALTNLLSNAVKYNREGGTVSLSVEETPGGRFRIAVTDSGPGIAEEAKAELFRPFSRLGMEGSDIPGTGIGLSITKQFVERMGGDVGLESTLGLGSTFWLEFSMVGGGLSFDVRKEEAEPARGTAAHMVLCVEDNPSNLKLLETLVGRIPNTAMLAAHTGELGLDLAEIHRPDVILMDINLPGIDGFEALKRLKASQATRDIPVIALTARASPQDRAQGLKDGFQEYLTKPINVAEVTAALENAIPAD